VFVSLCGIGSLPVGSGPFPTLPALAAGSEERRERGIVTCTQRSSSPCDLPGEIVEEHGEDVFVLPQDRLPCRVEGRVNRFATWLPWKPAPPPRAVGLFAHQCGYLYRFCHAFSCCPYVRECGQEGQFDVLVFVYFYGKTHGVRV